MSTEAFVRNESAREELWLNLVESSLELAEKKYKRVRKNHDMYLVSISLQAPFRGEFRGGGGYLFTPALYFLISKYKVYRSFSKNSAK